MIKKLKFILSRSQSIEHYDMSSLRITYYPLQRILFPPVEFSNTINTSNFLGYFLKLLKLVHFKSDASLLLNSKKNFETLGLYQKPLLS